MPLLTVLIVCITTAAVVTVWLRARDGKVTTDASLSLTSRQPSVNPVAGKHHALPGQAAVHHEPVVSRRQSMRSTDDERGGTPATTTCRLRASSWRQTEPLASRHGAEATSRRRG